MWTDSRYFSFSQAKNKDTSPSRLNFDRLKADAINLNISTIYFGRRKDRGRQRSRTFRLMGIFKESLIVK